MHAEKDLNKSNEKRKNVFRRIGRKNEDEQINTDGVAGRHYGLVTSFFTLLISVLGIFLSLAVRWLFDTWPKLQMDELVYQLSVSFQGTGGGMVQKFVFSVILPGLLCLIMIVILLILMTYSGEKIRRIGKLCMTVVAVVSIIISTTIFCRRMDVLTYLNNQMKGSEFIENNYVDPSTVNLVFPEKKRNLIMIYLESVETTFSSVSSGGAFETDVIPELTEISLSNESFSGDSTALNGGVSLPGTTWTMGGLFAATAGLPLQISISDNQMDSQSSFFPSITTLGDILHEAGYTSVFECGSDAVFGGRQLYFKTHGNYDIHDLNYYKAQDILKEDYYVWWGYEDQKLFTYAKEELSQLADQGQPFNYTMLTVDTHFEDGYVCDLCKDEYGEQYADAMACSSRQVSEFISWIQKQDWYENTTIVLTGDHPTMDSDFCNDIDTDYQRRVYTAYINADPAENNSKGMRSYTTFDTFPTVLSSLGVRIEGNRLGLGTDLFSGAETLLEKSDVLSLSAELSKSSDFMKEKASLQLDTDALINRDGISPGGQVSLLSYDETTGEAVYEVDDIFYLSGDIMQMRLYADSGDQKLSEGIMEYDGCGRYTGSLIIPEEYMDDVTVRIETDVQRENGTETVNIFDWTGSVYLSGASGNSFDRVLKGIESIDLSRYTVFMSVQTQASGKISDEEKEILDQLGISNLISADQPAAYAVLSEAGVKTGNGKDYVRENGTLKNGVPFVISSSSNEEQSSSIIVGSEFNDWSLHAKGINVVIYDMVKDEVVFQKAYNTADYGPACSIAVEKNSLFSSRYTVKVTDITGANTVSRVLVRIYDTSDSSYVQEQYMNLNFDHEYETQIDLKGHRKEDIVLYVYVEDTDFRYHFAGNSTIRQQNESSS